jgi:hypothetical protein
MQLASLASSARLIYRRIIIGWNECMVTRNARLKGSVANFLFQSFSY